MGHYRWRLFGVLAALLLVASACGGGQQPTAGPPTGAPATGVALPDLSGQTVEVAAAWSGGEQQNFEQVLAGFEQATGAETTFSSFGDNPSAFLGTRVEGGNPPDVAVLPQPGLVEDFVEQGALVPLSDETVREVEEHYAPVWKELATYRGQVYGVWFKAANKSTTWYNTNVFESAGVEPPQTYEELKSVGETLAAFGVTPFSVAGADGWTLTDWFENIYLRMAGPDTYDQLANHDIPWTHQSVKDALSTLAEIWGDDQLIIDNPLQVSFPDSVTKVFANPQDPTAGIVYEGDFVAGVIEDETNATLGTDADFFPFPEVAGSGPAVVVGGDQAVLMDDSEGGRALMRYLATPQAARPWASAGGFISPNRDLDPAVYPDDITRRMAEQVIEAETIRFDLSDLQPSAFGGTPGQGMWKLFQDFLADPDNVDGITRQLERAAAQAYRRGG